MASKMNTKDFFAEGTQPGSINIFWSEKGLLFMGYRKLRRERPNKKKRIQILCYRKNRSKCKASIFARCSADEGEEGYLNPDNWTVEKTSKHDHVKISRNLEEINLRTAVYPCASVSSLTRALYALSRAGEKPPSFLFKLRCRPALRLRAVRE